MTKKEKKTLESLLGKCRLVSECLDSDALATESDGAHTHNAMVLYSLVTSLYQDLAKSCDEGTLVCSTLD